MNIPSNVRDRYAKIDMVFETASPEIQQAIKVILPKIQHSVILLLSGFREDQLRTSAGKTALSKEIRNLVNKLLGEKEKTGVHEVLFTDFLIQ